jgi:hypothetical protein
VISVIIVRGTERSRHAVALNVIEAQNRAKHALKTLKGVDSVQLIEDYRTDNEVVLNTLRIVRRGR